MSDSVSRINSKKLISYISKEVSNVLENFVFEPKDHICLDKTFLIIDKFLDDIKRKRAIYDYTVDVKFDGKKIEYEDLNWIQKVFYDENDYYITSEEISIDLKIKPSKSLEIINFEFKVR